MHKYLRSVGFSKYTKKREIEDLIDRLIEDSGAVSMIQVDEETNACEVRAEVAPDLGICICGELDEEGIVQWEYYYPYLTGNNITSQAYCSVQRHAERETFAGMLEEYKVGVSLIFYLQNSMEYWDRELRRRPREVSSVMLSGLSIEGKILLPVKKTKSQIEMAKVASSDRSNRIEAARNGDEDAMESLTIEDIDLYSKISRRVMKEDVYSIVDSCFMPSGVECDQYSVIGDIVEMSLLTNSVTGEEVYHFVLDCNDLLFHVGINRLDLSGEPKIGRRFKGQIWMQGIVNFADDGNE